MGHIDEILDALSRIQEIVTRMSCVTRIELTEKGLDLPEMLDLSKSSQPACFLWRHCRSPQLSDLPEDI